MDTSPESYLTVRQHADALAHEAHPGKWRQHRNEPLDQLLHAIWLDQFGDETTPCLLLSPGDVKNHKRGFKQPPGRCPIRVLLWRLLPKGDYWVPDAIRSAHEQGPYPWDEMADLPWDDYDDPWRRRIIEQVVILGSVFPQWKTRHWTGKQKRRGRTKGSGSLESQDAPLVKEIDKMVAEGKATSRWDAAGKVATRAEGPGTLLSKATRLVKRPRP